MHYSGRSFAANGILDDATCDMLASVGPIDEVETLEQLLKSSWSRWSELGQRLFVYMKGLRIPPLPPPPTRQKKAAANPQPLPQPSASQLRERLTTKLHRQQLVFVLITSLPSYRRYLLILSIQSIRHTRYSKLPSFLGHSPDHIIGAMKTPSTILLDITCLTVTPWAASTSFCPPILTRDGFTLFHTIPS
ncbi:hypothetical protein B0H14DRAFT_3579264 [Mycena olivaceomarginata]|nr:hypothetical protein B0H14DRAFT_3579264 [Mycena olivaceomarginata]